MGRAGGRYDYVYSGGTGGERKVNLTFHTAQEKSRNNDKTG